MLTALAIEKLKPKERPYRLSDGNQLSLLVEPSGRKLWRLRYRFGGKANMLSLGSFPEVSLASARAKRDEAHALLADGKDPSQQRKLQKLATAAAARNTFGAIAEEVLEQMQANRAAETTLCKNRWMLFKLAAPLVDRPIAEITAAEVLSVLRVVEKSGRRESAKAARDDRQGLPLCNCKRPFCLERARNGKRRFLFFPGIEADCGTEPVDTGDPERSSIAKKFAALPSSSKAFIARTSASQFLCAVHCHELNEAQLHDGTRRAAHRQARIEDPALYDLPKSYFSLDR